MILDAYWLVLLGCIIVIPRYLISLFQVNRTPEKVETRRLEMIGIIKWTGIISLCGFIIISGIAILKVVFGASFYDTFKYFDSDDMEEKSFFFTYRSMFFVGIVSLVIFLLFGGTFGHLLNGKWIDEDLRK